MMLAAHSVAAARGALRTRRRTVVTGGIAASVLITGGAFFVDHHKKKTSCLALESSQKLLVSHEPPSMSLVVPTVAATLRVLRLLQTAALIAFDYKTADWDWIRGSKETNAKQQVQEERDYWEKETERRRKVLADLQERGRSLQKEVMQEAAELLAEAEEKLRRLESRTSLLHRGAAQRLLKLCHDNGGVYIKIGQHLANLDYLIPQEYIETLGALFDDNPRTSYEDVRKVIEEDFGKGPEEIFDSFEPDPIASASLAQVHVAYAKGTGRKLAVKVQHRGLRETSRGDVFAVVSVVRLADTLFEGFTWGWIADEIAPQLPKELDFQREGRNAERAADHIRSTGLDCVIPKVLWDHSSPRVLTMEFEEGFKATNVRAIEDAGLNKRDVAKLISSVFASQVFRSGFVHCDPHPANVLLRSRGGKPQIVLVDHGLYRELDRPFLRDYSRLWKSLMIADLDGIKSACHDLGVDRAYTLFAAMLTARPYYEIIERSKKGSLRHQTDPNSMGDRAVIRGYAQRYVSDIFGLLSAVPRQMLLLLKMNDCLRHIDYALGSPANTLVVSGHYASEAVYLDEVRQRRQNNHQLNLVHRFKGFKAWCEFMHVLLRIKVHDILVWWTDKIKI